MDEINPNKSISTVADNICVIIVLPSPPSNFSYSDWYLKEICGIPFIMRNVLNLQRSGPNSLIIYSNENNADLYKRLRDEKKVSIKLDWISDVDEVIRSTKGCPVLVLSGGALYTKQEIQSGINFAESNCGNPSKSFENKNMANILDQIVIKNEFLVSSSVGNLDSSIIFLPAMKDAWINRPKDFLDQQEKLLKDSGLDNDSFLDKTVTRFFSRQLTRLFLKTSLSPNIITFFSLAIGLISAWHFFQGNYQNILIGAGLILLSAWVDCTDGEIARLKFLESEFGGKLDIICDNLVHIAVFFAIGLGLYQSTGESIFKLLGAFASFGALASFLLLSSSIINEKEKASEKKSGLKIKNNLTAKLANRDFVYLLSFMAVIGRVDVFILITAVGSNLFACYLIYSRLKSSLPTS